VGGRKRRPYVESPKRRAWGGKRWKGSVSPRRKRRTGQELPIREKRKNLGKGGRGRGVKDWLNAW